MPSYLTNYLPDILLSYSVSLRRLLATGLFLLNLLLLLVPSAAMASLCDQPKTIPIQSYQALVKDRGVSLIVYDLKGNHCWATDNQDIQKRHAPWSSFKIPNSLIALETGAAKSDQELIEWDSRLDPPLDYWPSSWRQDQTLATAFQRSVYWYHQQLASRIGDANYQYWLKKFAYGNRDIGDYSDESRYAFWLGAELQVSPLEQLRFLSCLVQTGCGLSTKTIDLFEEFALNEQSQGLSLFAKTGAGPNVQSDIDGSFGGWFVGYIRDSSAQPIAVFALHVDAENYGDLQYFRKDFSLQMLAKLGFWPEQPNPNP